MKNLCGNGVRQVSMSRYQREDVGSNPNLPHQISFVNSNTDKHTRNFFREIINTHHKYKDWSDYVGRRIGWVVLLDNEMIGVIGIASPPLNISVRDNWIGWNKKQRQKNLVKVANNYRFCLIPQGLGSKVLSKFYSTARKAWKEKYGDTLVLLTTMVQPPFKGTVYLASGWKYLGKTKGFSLKRPPSKALIKRELSGEWGKAHSDRAKLICEEGWKKSLLKIPYWEFSQKTTTPKLIFAKPLHRYWKKVLMKIP